MARTYLTLKILAVTVILFCSCKKDHNKYHLLETTLAKSFVQEYDSIDELIFQQSQTRRILVTIRHSKMVGGKQRTLHIYDSLCKKHNDLSYYRKIYTSHIGYTAIGTDLQKIEITANKDYDAEHRAGELLNDIVRFISGTPYPFVKSGYKKTFNTEQPLSALYEVNGRIYLRRYIAVYHDFEDSSLSPVFPVDKMVSELTQDDLTLLSPLFGQFYVEKLPKVKGDYEFLIRLYGDDGKIYSGTALMKF